MMHKTEFRCAKRGHHVYKITWFSVINDKLDCKKKNQEEALSYDKHVVEVFLKNGNVSYIPSELSNLIYFFLKSAEENFTSAAVVVLRKSEVELVVPAKFMAATKTLKVANVLYNKILNEKNKHAHFELSFDDSKNLKRP